MIYVFSGAAFIFYAAMFTLIFHYDRSVFSRLKSSFWNPSISWINKWKIENGEIQESKERFLGSSTVFVFLTDGFHLMQFFFENSIMLAVSVERDIKFYYLFLILRGMYSVIFNLMFSKALIKDEKDN